MFDDTILRVAPKATQLSRNILNSLVIQCTRSGVSSENAMPMPVRIFMSCALDSAVGSGSRLAWRM